ncbi:hypothetical protein GIB67_004199 [Kingdonia uniflora]|uniref:MADF domain-containing protein n=1 Tax=Kingdonia uniflora TaxID=39325 RepID=A0A7J7P0X9_9MAGN|nr:hypothetical protein GIB67_004199 [Kingdonia uniflora]
MPFIKVQHPLFFDYVKDLWFIVQAQYEIDTYDTDESANLKLSLFRNMRERGIQEFERDVTLKSLRNRWRYLKNKYKNLVTLKQLAGEGYNEVTGTFNLTKLRTVQVHLLYHLVNSEAKKYKTAPLQRRYLLEKLFNGLSVTGDFA